jgi:hypothetical protein
VTGALVGAPGIGGKGDPPGGARRLERTIAHPLSAAGGRGSTNGLAGTVEEMFYLLNSVGELKQSSEGPDAFARQKNFLSAGLPQTGAGC